MTDMQAEAEGTSAIETLETVGLTHAISEKQR